ncbi:MAG: carboxypeptidase regulatory-like domain-containing protein [Acidobacteriota bacterium]
MKKNHVLSTFIVPIFLAAACGGGGETSAPAPPPAAPPAASATGGGASGAATGSASIHGKILFEGDAPKPAAIRMSADPVCQKTHSGPVYSEAITVNDNGRLKDVFVYVKAGLEGKTYPVPSEPVTFDQKGCQYIPHVIGLRAKQTLKILNNDDTLHNIHALPSKNKQFNIAMPKFKKEQDVSFDQPEVMIRVKCEVHPWMGAWIGVLDHPFFSVSDDQGAFSLEGLPAGQYTIEAWHEKLGQQTQEVTLADGAAEEISFTFSMP